MRKVANKKIIRRLSYRTMREKKWKNLIAVLAIALTTLLFTALFTVGGSMVDSIQESTMRQVGTSSHGGYKYLSMEEYEKIKAAGGYQDISYDIIAGFGSNPELNTIQTEVRFAEDKMAKWSFSYPERGSMPKKKNECAASSKVLETLGVPLKLGEKVPITITGHDKDGKEWVREEEFVLSGFWYSNDASRAQEFWISKEWLDENVDILEENYYRREKEKGLYHPEGTIQAGVYFRSSFDIEAQVEELTERAGFTEDEIKSSINWAYGTSSVDSMTLFLGIGLLFVILLSGYLIIYNIFYINVTTDIRYYGLLKTIGTTGKQLRRMVRSQAFMLSAAGIPIGLFAGWFVGKGILPAVYGAIDTGGVRNVVINPFIFAGSALFSLFVVYLSCIKPCRLATKVSPIEAVRYVENKSYKKKEKRSVKVSALSLAAANMGRNKRKAAAVITSLSLSLILLNGTYCLVKGFSFDMYVQDYLLKDMQLAHFSAVNMAAPYKDYEAVTSEVVSEIEKIPGVEKIDTLQNRDGFVLLSEEMIKRFTDYYHSEEKKEEMERPWMADIVEGVREAKGTNVQSYHVFDELLSYISVEQGNFDKEKFEQGGYALLLSDKDSVNWACIGDKVTVGTYGDETGAMPKKELEIMAVGKLPYAISTRSLTIGGIRLLLCEKDFEELYEVRGSLYACIDVEEGRDNEIAEEINDLLETKYPELVLITKETLREEFKTESAMFTVIGGLLGFILAVIGILNLINAMITGILARKQEFAMMQAVGMTGKQLQQMLMMEGVCYGVWTLLISATFGNLVSYGLIYMIGRNMAFFEWNFYILPFIISIPVIAAMSVVLPVICYHALCKKSIIERLRLAEV